MDLLDILRADIAALPPGPHVPGLRGVQHQIETGLRHLDRGRSAPDRTAFTDAVYRCNQAFEGAIKEAYRVLAARDPGREPLVRMEDYLEREAVLRPRVMAQFRSYRQEWRNPSTHDHLLEFDEAEAFLALVSIAAFAKLLLDRIAERLARDALRPEDGFGLAAAAADRPLVAVVADALAGGDTLRRLGGLPTPSQRIGAAAGLLDALGVAVITGDGGGAPDLLVTRDAERLAIDFLAGAPAAAPSVLAARDRLLRMVAGGSASAGLLMLLGPEADRPDLLQPDPGEPVWVLGPAANQADPG